MERQRKYHNLLYKNRQTDSTCEAEYTNDLTLDIKEEIDEDQEATGQDYNKKYESKCFTLGIKETEKFSVKKLPIHKKQKIWESEQKSEKEYKCEKCARTYIRNRSLIAHQKFECNVIPQFSCKFCNKRFKIKSNVNRHIVQVHQKPNSNASLRHNCDECSRSYTSRNNLSRHKRSEHAGVKPQLLFCDLCGHKTTRKSCLSAHISVRHLK
ncbi:zinc finger protein 761-like [Belonocnema kinseyi]|uniref:zinc finger protein 761-like n=1 Tax=Belonocnema kinseyi TaxID=2817044 RepID=UPI00143D8E25|nr:zinc finger protein 761-like [Belonocnema kinseyi]